MTKEFEINDILDAVKSISKIERKRKNPPQTGKNQHNNNDNEDVLTLNNQVKSNKSDVLVLKQMIE